MISRLKTYYKDTSNTCFIHIPKCGGTSVVAAIYKGYGYHRIADFLKLSDLHPLELSSRASKRTADLFDEELLLHRSKLIHYLLHANEQCRYAHGHFPFGRSLHRAFQDRFHFATVLRDPVQRWFSHFYYSKGHPTSPFYIRAPIEAFIETDRAKHLGNLYTQYLTDPSKHNSTTEELKEEALDNLRLFSVIGILEDLDPFVHQFKKRIGIELTIPHRNKTAEGKEELQRYRTQVTDLCSADMEIYQRAKKLSRENTA